MSFASIRYFYLHISSLLLAVISKRATPDPFPNSEVKPLVADGTAATLLWESRLLPAFIFNSPTITVGLFSFLDSRFKLIKVSFDLSPKGQIL